MRFPLICTVIAIGIWSAAAISPEVTRRQNTISLATPVPVVTPFPILTEPHNELRYASFYHSLEDFLLTDIREPKKRATGTKSKTKTKSSATTSATASATSTQTSKPKKSGLSTGAIIGIAVGISLGVVAIGGGAIAWIFARRRKRRVDDPSAGAGQKIRDPSDEAVSSVDSTPPLSNATAHGGPAVAELPSVRSDEWQGLIASGQKNAGGWWPFGRANSTKKDRYAYELSPNAPQSPRSPQELPA